NAGHGMGGAYGQKRMRDFFVRHLIEAAPGVERSLASSNAPQSSRSAGATQIARPASESAGSKAKMDPIDRSRTASGLAATRQTESTSSGPLTLDMADLNNDRSELRGVILRFSADRNTQQGTLPQGSRERDHRSREFNARWLDQLARLDFYQLSQDGKVDYLLLKNYLGHQQRQLDVRARERKEGEALVPFSRTIADLEAARRELRPMDWSQVADNVNRMAKSIDEARRSLEREGRNRSAVKRLVANRALADVESLRG